MVVKETNITYTICAIAAGKFKIGSASIKINNKPYSSLPLSITVEQGECFFSRKPLPSDGKPYRYKMFHKAETGTDKNRFMQNMLHTVLIPRSHKAYVLHNIGVALKIIFSMWGGVVAAEAGFSVMAGFAAGSVYGAACIYLLYAISGVKPKFLFTDKHPVVRDYFSKGYHQGDETGSDSRFILAAAFFTRMMY